MCVCLCVCAYVHVCTCVRLHVCVHVNRREWGWELEHEFWVRIFREAAAPRCLSVRFCGPQTRGWTRWLLCSPRSTCADSHRRVAVGAPERGGCAHACLIIRSVSRSDTSVRSGRGEPRVFPAFPRRESLPCLSHMEGGFSKNKNKNMEEKGGEETVLDAPWASGLRFVSQVLLD